MNNSKSGIGRFPKLVFMMIAVGCLLLKYSHLSAQEISMHVKIHIDGRTFSATLNDSQASRDFVAMMPLTLQLNDYAGAEKISDLPGRLSTSDSPRGSDAIKGDICLYAPWGNLALFYKTQSYAVGLVKIGQLDAPESFPFKANTISAVFERAD